MRDILIALKFVLVLCVLVAISGWRAMAVEVPSRLSAHSLADMTSIPMDAQATSESE